VEQPRDFPLELLIGLREEMAELRTTVAHLSAESAEFRQEVRADIRRLDARVFQLMLAQIATLATALGSLVATLAK
jgi:hypothetical protein